MKRFLLAALFVACYFCTVACSSNGEKATSTIVVNDCPLVGTWRSDDGHLLYIPKEMILDEEMDYDNAHYFAHAYYEYDEEGIYYGVQIVNYEDGGWGLDPWRFEEEDFQEFNENYLNEEESIECEDFYYKPEEAILYDSEDRPYHKAQSLDGKMKKRMAKKIQEYNNLKDKYIKEESKNLIPEKYTWIYGEWRCDENGDSIIIKEPNLVNLDNYGWLKFGYSGDRVYINLHAYINHFWKELLINDDKLTLYYTDENDVEHKYVKVEGATQVNSKEKTSPRKSKDKDIDKVLIIGEWVFRHGKTGDLNLSQEYEEGVRFNSDMSGVFNSFIATYRGLDRTDRKRTGSFTFTWDIEGNQVYVTVDGDRSPSFTYKNGSLIDSGGNAFSRQ